MINLMDFVYNDICESIINENENNIKSKNIVQLRKQYCERKGTKYCTKYIESTISHQ